MAEQTAFLYPFLDRAADDPDVLLADLSRSAAAKWDESTELRRAVCASHADELRRAASAVAVRIGAGGRLFAFGNGGSAADADAFVDRCRAVRPRPLPALSLVADAGVLSALANDIGVDAVFSRQLEACGRAGDVAVAFSTSGGSTNLLRAIERCAAGGILVVGLTGGGGVQLGAGVDHRFVVDATSVHRIQEAQTALSIELVTAIAAAVRPVDEVHT